MRGVTAAHSIPKKINCKGDDHMTDQEMRERMETIEKEREQLRKELYEYKKYFEEKENDKTYNERKVYEGKCYKVSNTMFRYADDNIKYFKILEVSEEYSDDATCICLFGKLTDTEYGVEYSDLSLWDYNDYEFIHNPYDLRLIDVCKEISHEEFMTHYQEYIDKITEELSIS